jgi:RNA polymerase sigma factor (sigma-70 family)
MSGSAAALPPASVWAVPLRMFGDDRLVRLAAGGNQRAFAMIYERHHQALYRYCRSIVRDEHDAEDVLQTTVARALAALGKGPPDAPPRAWLFRIAHNEAVSLLRARRPTAELDETDRPTGLSVEDRAEERARLALLVADLGELPERQRSALVMRELSGLSHTEIACALGVSLSGAKQAIFEARVGLQEFAKGRAMTCAEIQQLISDADGRTLRGRPVRAHLRSCADCRALRDAIGRRRSDLAAIAPPLPAAMAAGVLARLFGGGQAGGGGAAATAAAGKAGTLAVAGKLAAGAVVLATVGAGAPKIIEGTTHPATGSGHGTTTVQGAAASAAIGRPIASGQTGSRRRVLTSVTAPGHAAADHDGQAAGGADRHPAAATSARGRPSIAIHAGASTPTASRKRGHAGAAARAQHPSKAPSRPTTSTRTRSRSRPSTASPPAPPPATTKPGPQTAPPVAPPSSTAQPSSPSTPTTATTGPSASRPAPAGAPDRLPTNPHG